MICHACESRGLYTLCIIHIHTYARKWSKVKWHQQQICRETMSSCNFQIFWLLLQGLDSSLRNPIMKTTIVHCLPKISLDNNYISPVDHRKEDCSLKRNYYYTHTQIVIEIMGLEMGLDLWLISFVTDFPITTIFF